MAIGGVHEIVNRAPARIPRQGEACAAAPGRGNAPKKAAHLADLLRAFVPLTLY